LKNKKNRKKNDSKSKVHSFAVKAVIVSFSVACIYFLFFFKLKPSDPLTIFKLDSIETNYASEIEAICKEKDLPPHYFKALIMLETSGKVPAGQRFEPHVYEKLIKLRNGSLKRFEDIRARDLKGLSREEIKRLATSFGPFQIMGYKSIKISCPVSDLYNKKAIPTGINWIEEEYGWLLEQERYSDAFHYHNTGRLHPLNAEAQTHSPDYVKDGLKYMNYFDF